MLFLVGSFINLHMDDCLFFRNDDEMEMRKNKKVDESIAILKIESMKGKELN